MAPCFTVSNKRTKNATVLLEEEDARIAERTEKYTFVNIGKHEEGSGLWSGGEQWKRRFEDGEGRGREGFLSSLGVVCGFRYVGTIRLLGTGQKFPPYYCGLSQRQK